MRRNSHAAIPAAVMIMSQTLQLGPSIARLTKSGIPMTATAMRGMRSGFLAVTLGLSSATPFYRYEARETLLRRVRVAVCFASSLLERRRSGYLQRRRAQGHWNLTQK